VLGALGKTQQRQRPPRYEIFHLDESHVEQDQGTEDVKSRCWEVE